MKLLNELNSSSRGDESGVYTKPENYDRHYRGAMKRYKMIDGVEHTEDSKGNWVPILFTASVGEMPSICGSQLDAKKVFEKATKSELEKELKKSGYYDVSYDDVAHLANNVFDRERQIKNLSTDLKYLVAMRKRKIKNQCMERVKHIGDKAVKEWTKNNIKSFIDGTRNIDKIESAPLTTQDELDGNEVQNEPLT
ncbi:hypothetical protein EM59_016475 [Vibrio parahaemolyticus]|uniref:hypothetical protein n=1 Tax=Vibrio parahaemolyticus TaxID=670 RepID=UPI0009F105D2|nr:hypothetical protein [Vibrio parahaemolyticus]EGQ7650924.1 hypothetical protein [Vibrio parahaemolyticus]EGQ9979476.1 hypothetical protein [Vibrio parahaemolyticus]EJG1824806.1 hypothetical protein [Vibrio parahaemolyticus]ELB2744115.1 hypothetical protein [Vibrio parahaemolyticus]ELC9528614.1 hypothetical protein [Vibrio parahaemolyticus]